MTNKLRRVVSVKTVKFEDIIRTTNNITIHYKQEHTYTLDCGHRQHEVVHIGKCAKSKMKCRACVKRLSDDHEKKI